MRERIERTLGQNILLYRMRKGFTQKDLADKIDMSIQTLSRIENDAVNPTYETLTKLIEALNITPNQLFGVEYYENIHLQAPFARNLRAIRENAHVSKKRFAKVLNIEVQELTDLEDGTLIPSKDLLNNICKNLLISEDDLTENCFHRRTKNEAELLKKIKDNNRTIENLISISNNADSDYPEEVAKDQILYYLKKVPFQTLLRVYKNTMNEEILKLSDKI